MVKLRREQYSKTFKIANQQSNKQTPPTTTCHDPPKKPTSGQTNQSQSSTRISFQENPYTFEERHASLSESLIPATRQEHLSERQYETTC